MGRLAKAFIYGYQVITIETDLVDKNINYKFDVEGRLRGGNRDLAPQSWNYMFGLYIVDKYDRLVYLYEPQGSTAKSLMNDIQIIKSEIHPSVKEVFDIVEIIEEETNKVIKILKNVNLIGILEGIKEVFDEKTRTSNPQDIKNRRH